MENAFKIWVNIFRMFASRATLAPEKASVVLMTALALIYRA